MKKPKRRLIRVIYRYRIISRSTHPKTPSDNKKAITSTDQAEVQNATSTPKIASKPSSTLATFDSLCNPYQQFIDNLSFSLTNLPTEVFTGTTAPIELFPQEKNEKLDITAEEETMAAETQDVTAEQKTITEAEETTNPKNTVKAISHANGVDSTSYEPTTIEIQTSPNLRYLSGIPSCFLT